MDEYKNNQHKAHRPYDLRGRHHATNEQMVNYEHEQ